MPRGIAARVFLRKGDLPLMSSPTTSENGAATIAWIRSLSPVSCSATGPFKNRRERWCAWLKPYSRSSAFPLSRRKNDMWGSPIRLNAELLARLKKYSQASGYSSVEEFITHALEKELAHLEASESEEELRKRLKGLGY